MRCKGHWERITHPQELQVTGVVRPVLQDLEPLLGDECHVVHGQEPPRVQGGPVQLIEHNKETSRCKDDGLHLLCCQLLKEVHLEAVATRRSRLAQELQRHGPHVNQWDAILRLNPSSASKWVLQGCQTKPQAGQHCVQKVLDASGVFSLDRFSFDVKPPRREFAN